MDVLEPFLTKAMKQSPEMQGGPGLWQPALAPAAFHSAGAPLCQRKLFVLQRGLLSFFYFQSSVPRNSSITAHPGPPGFQSSVPGIVSS